MNRNEFEALRNLSGKTIKGDIRFEAKAQIRPILSFEIDVQNTPGWDITLNGTYKPDIPSDKF